MNPAILYQYIAESDPYSAKAICNKYGYSLANAESYLDVAAGLEQVVGENGQPAFLEILALHPDKDVILEVYGNTQTATAKKPCSCGDGEKKKSAINAYIQAPADANNSSMQQANIFLMAAALILAVAIISK